MPEFGGMQSTPALSLLPGPLRPGAVTLDKGPIHWSNKTECKQMTYAKLNCLKYNFLII